MICLRRFNFPTGKRFSLTAVEFPLTAIQRPLIGIKYDQPGQVTVSGIIRLGQSQPTPGSDTDPTLAPDQTRLDFWIYINLDRISQQIPYPILPVYIQLTPAPNHTDPPIPDFQRPLDLSDGYDELELCLSMVLVRNFIYSLAMAIISGERN